MGLGNQRKGKPLLLEISCLDVGKTPAVVPIISEAGNLWVPFPEGSQRLYCGPGFELNAQAFDKANGNHAPCTE